MKDILFKLAKTFSTLNYHQEAGLIDLLLKIAGYDDKWREKIQNLSQQNPKPFNQWLDGKNRIYFDFKPEGIVNPIPDPEIKDFLEDQNGYQITDYIGGYCQKDGRTFRIAKVIQKLMMEDIKEINNSPESELQDKAESVIEIRGFYENLQNIFLHSSIRANKQYFNNLKIVISQDPHDIARMSFERNWNSCMNIETGAYKQQVFCEVSQGGLVAYLITGDDLDIEEPLARVHIRRFVGLDGVNLAKPEQTVYGNETAGFLNFVDEWVAKKNRESLGERSQLGLYKMKGSEHSDTYSDLYVETPETKEELVNWVRGKNLPQHEESTWTICDNYFEQIKGSYFGDVEGLEDFDGCRTFDNEADVYRLKRRLEYLGDESDSWIDSLINEDDVIEEARERGVSREQVRNSEIDRLLADRFEITKHDHSYADTAKVEAFRKLIDFHLDEIDQSLAAELVKYSEDTKKGFDNGRINTLFKKFPDLLTSEKFKKGGIRQQVEWIALFDESNPKKADELNHVFRFSVAENLNPEGEAIKGILHRAEHIYNIRSNPATDTRQGLFNLISPIFDHSIDSKLYSILQKFIFDDVKNIKYLNGNNLDIFYKDMLLRASSRKMEASAAIDFAQKMYAKLNLTEFGDEKLAKWLRFVGDLRARGTPLIPLLKQMLNNVESDTTKNHAWLYFKNQNDISGFDSTESDRKREVETRTRRLLGAIDQIENDLYYSKKYPFDKYQSFV